MKADTNIRVLVIDDDHDLREEIVDLLLDAGIDAMSAKDGRDGLLEARLQLPLDAIVLDLRMPMMDAREFRSIQLSDPILASIPVIVVSGDQDVALSAARLGARAVVSKPFHPEALLAAVRECQRPIQHVTLLQPEL